jgi:uncharacterized membrane protein YGL010W
MRTLEQVLTQYAAFHRDRRNIATHFIGVPLIVFAVVLALAQISFGGIHFGWFAVLAASAYYLWLDRPLGILMLASLVLCAAVASLVSAKTGLTAGLVIALVIFALGWAIQFIGHYFEGMKPAFVDDLIGLAIGPLFVAAEGVFMLGMRRELAAHIEARVGPTLARRDGRPIGPAATKSAPIAPLT